VDRSYRPSACPHQISAELEARICELRREHPGWGPWRICHELAKQGAASITTAGSISHIHGQADARAYCEDALPRLMGLAFGKFGAGVNQARRSGDGSAS
jgi:hypothetical protein